MALDKPSGLAVAARPPVPSDLSWLTGSAADKDLRSPRWRGPVAARADIEAVLWAGVIAQWVVVDEAARPFALVQFSDADLRHGYCNIDVVRPHDASAHHVVVAVEAGLELLRRSFPIRRVIAHLLQPPEREQPSFFGIEWSEEGRLADHAVSGDGYDDLLILGRNLWTHPPSRLLLSSDD